jgi:uncharacterized protein (DUF58 family)
VCANRLKQFEQPAGARQPADDAGKTRESLFARAEVLASTLPPLLVAAERVAATVAQGVHGRRRVGQGETFWQFRRYQPGDSTQAIDWRQSAKSQHLFVRQTEWEAAQSVWLWRDDSASMDYRSSALFPTKRERAEILLLALASLLARGGEHLALLGKGMVPAPGRASLRRMAASLERRCRKGSGLPAVEPLPRHGRLVLFGDFLVTLSELQATVTAYASQGIRGHLVQILDEAEETLPFSGRVLFEGVEDEKSVLFGRTEAIRDGYRAAFGQHRDGLEAVARTAGWTLAIHHTSQPPEPALLALFLTLAEILGP